MDPAKLRAEWRARAERRRARGGEVGAWWNPASPDDVRAEQKRADATRAAITASLLTTPPSGDPVQVDNAVRAWNALDAQVRAYVLEDPSALWWTRDEQVKRGTDYEAQMEGLRQQLGKLSVSVPPPPATPPPTPGGAFSLPGVSEVTDLVKWGVIAWAAFTFLGKGK